MDLKEILITEDASLILAMEKIDKASKKVVFVEHDGKLLGVITDGDVRRWILKKGNLDARVKDIANYSPKYLLEKDHLNAKEVMNTYKIDCIPLVNAEMQIQAVIFRDDVTVEHVPNLTIPVVIMAGGLGTRLYPYTKILPKPLIPIGELPIAEHIINQFRSFGIKEFFMIVNHKKNMIKAYFSEIQNDFSLKFEDEDVPLGTGGGLSLLKGKIQSTFILTNCDILIYDDYEKIVKFHKAERNLITMICSLKTIKIPYGVIDIDQQGNIEKMREKPEFTYFTNAGVYIIEPQVIEQIQNKQFITFPEIIEHQLMLGGKVGVYPVSESAWMDMGELDQMEEMRRRLMHD